MGRRKVLFTAAFSLILGAKSCFFAFRSSRTQTAESPQIPRPFQFWLVRWIARASGDRYSKETCPSDPYTPRKRRSPKTRQKGASSYSSTSTDKLSYYHEVRNPMGLSSALRATLRTSFLPFFCSPLPSKLSLIFLHDLHTETHGSQELDFSFQIFLFPLGTTDARMSPSRLGFLLGASSTLIGSIMSYTRLES